MNLEAAGEIRRDPLEKPKELRMTVPPVLTADNLVERLFAEVTQRCVRRGSHTAFGALEKAMLDYLDQRNRDPKPFVWTADADLILGKVERLSKRISDRKSTRLNSSHT